MVYIRVDANSKIGMGHMMRCISVAEALMDEGEKIQFLVAQNDATDILEKKGLPYIVLNTDYTDMESESLLLEKIFNENEKILVDSYQVTEKYLKFLKRFGQVIYIDDVHSFEYPVDCVINGNIYGEQMEYRVPISLRGCKYAMLRKEFSLEKNKREPKNILITTGGSDPYGFTEKIIEHILNDPVLKKEQYDVVCGKFSGSYEKLCELGKKHSNFHIHQNVKEMWKLMQKAKVAVTAGGTTMTELSCMGVPMVGFSFADNQKKVVQTFYEEGYAHFGADYETLGDAIFENMCRAIKELVVNEDLCHEYSKKLMTLVDGKGCRRIAKQLISM